MMHDGKAGGEAPGGRPGEQVQHQGRTAAALSRMHNSLARGGAQLQRTLASGNKRGGAGLA